MARFLLLHASDLHFSTSPSCVGAVPDFLPALRQGFRGRLGTVSTHNEDAADAFAYFVYKYQQQNGRALDLIVLSGDLAARGDAADLAASRAFITAPATQGYLAQDGKPTLSAAGTPVVLIPGNHDRFGQVPLLPAALALCPPGDITFDGVFANEWQAGQGAQPLYLLNRGGANLALVGVDFTLVAGDWGRPPLGHYGQGRAYRQRVADLEKLTRQLQVRYPGCAVLWVVHFEPGTKTYLLKLLQEVNLAQAATRCGVVAILCGHTHRSRRAKRFANVPLSLCGTTTQFYAPHGNFLHILEIDVPPGAGQATVALLQRFRFDHLPPGYRNGFNQVP